MRKRTILKQWYNSVDVLRMTSHHYPSKAEHAQENTLKAKAF